MNRLFSLCLLLPLCVVITIASAAPRSRVEDKLVSRLTNDQRFTKAVLLPARRGQLGDVIHAFSRTAKVRMIVRSQEGPDRAGSEDPDLILTAVLADDPAIIRYQHGRASQFLECIAAATNARWVPVKNSWVLTDTPELAHLLQLSAIQLQLLAGHGTKTLKQFTPKQLDLLATRSYLLPEDLTALQRRGLAEASDVEFMTSESIVPEARQLQGVYVQIEKTGKTDGEPYDLAIVYPRRDGRQLSTLRVPIEELTLPPTAGVPLTRHTPPAAPILPESWPQPSQSSPDDRPTANTSLAKPTTFRVGDVMSALQSVIAASEVDLVASTQFYYWPVRPSGTPPITVGAVMESVAAVTGGQWKRVSGTYVLQPHPALERVVQLSPEMRREWLGGMLGMVQQSLTGRQRETLAKDHHLLATQLTRKQQDALRWAAALGYVSGRTDLKATRLDDVELVYEKADLKSQVPARVHYVFPRRPQPMSGIGAVGQATIELATLPLR